MPLTTELLEHCEDFLKQMEFGAQEGALAEGIDAVRAYLNRRLEGWTRAGKECLAYGILKNLEGAWNCLTEREKKRAGLECHFAGLTEELKEICRDRLLMEQEHKLDAFGDLDAEDSDEAREENGWSDEWDDTDEFFNEHDEEYFYEDE